MLVIPLQSGSNGNCIYVEADGVRLVFDAGLSGRRARERLASRGRRMDGADALIVSHDHTDHTRSAGVFHRMFGVPLHITEPTLAACGGRLGRLRDVRPFRAGGTLRFGEVSVEAIPTPHDGADGCAFVVQSGGRRLGILTDLGHVFPRLEELLPGLDAVVIESNYDAEMLEDGPYPAFLKERIRGPGGHISNAESARLLASRAGERLQWACLAHLSENNNRPELALRTHRRLRSGAYSLHVAGRHAAAGPLRIAAPPPGGR